MDTTNFTLADLAGKDLKGADLSGKNLRFVDLSGANLSKANLQLTQRLDAGWL